MKELIFASNNKHKIEQLKEQLVGMKIMALKDIGYNEEIEETGTTFLENAIIKAKTISDYMKEKGKPCAVLADDSGICCDALNGEPGIYSGRYAKTDGEHDWKANREKLIKNLKGKDNSAYFICVMVLYQPDGTYEYREGRCYGKIIDEERGDITFGYEPIFLSDDLNMTFGEASHEEKYKISHRSKALNQIKKLF